MNGHFRLPTPVRLPGNAVLLGLIGGTAEWLFVRDDLVSLTVSAADTLADETSGSIASRLWADTAAALGLPTTAAAAGAHRQGAPRHIRADAGTSRPAPARGDPVGQSVPGR